MHVGAVSLGSYRASGSSADPFWTYNSDGDAVQASYAYGSLANLKNMRL